MIDYAQQHNDGDDAVLEDEDGLQVLDRAIAEARNPRKERVDLV